MAEAAHPVTPPLAAPVPATAGPLIARHVWARIAVIAGLLIPLHSDILWRMVGVVTLQPREAPTSGLVGGILGTLGLKPFGYAWTSGDWSHVILIPFISIYFITQHAHELRSRLPRTCWAGLVVFLAGLAGYLVAIYPIRDDMIKGYCMIVEIFGITLLMVGPSMMKVLWFPIVYLGFAIKVGDQTWGAVAWQLQQIAARSAAVILNLIGIDAQIHGTTIELYHGLNRLEALNVAEACSGLRMLMTFIALGVAVAYLWERPWWARLTLVLMTVPIAIAVNIGRVTTMGILSLVAPGYNRGDFHVFVGMLMLIPAFILFVALGWVLNKILIPVEEEKKTKSA